MAYKANPFLERMSEVMTSDSDFVSLFSPKIIERLGEDVFAGGVHVLRSSPGGGKTTLLRAFTPPALNAFWSAKGTPELAEAYSKLVARGVVDSSEGPQLLGVFLTCSSGYADLPRGADISQDTLFRALLDSRVVLRAVRSVAALAGLAPGENLTKIHLSYSAAAADLKSVPLFEDAEQMAQWAEELEQAIYSSLDSFSRRNDERMPAHVRFESVLWLQHVSFSYDGREIAPRRLLMIDDVWTLKKRQRELLIDELIVLRATIPIWLSDRTISASEQDLLSQGSRLDRDIHYIILEDLWASKSTAFVSFAQNILDRRMKRQDTLAASSFSNCLRTELNVVEVRKFFDLAKDVFEIFASREDRVAKYKNWLTRGYQLLETPSFEALLDLFSIQILVSRDESKRQMTLELSEEELDERDSSQVKAAAEILANDKIGIPYFYGLDRLCAMATSNPDELLFLAAELYTGLQARQMLRRDLILSPEEQEKSLVAASKKKRDFIPGNHSQGRQAQRLLDAIGSYCRDRTFMPNAPYAPGVTGVRLSHYELSKFQSGSKPVPENLERLSKVIAECVAENLLVVRPSAASTSRDSGNVFYLNRTLCANYGLPLQYGGWQEVTVGDLERWVESGSTQTRRRRLDTL